MFVIFWRLKNGLLDQKRFALLSILMFAAPFVHLGFSYYASVAALMAFLVVFISVRTIIATLHEQSPILLLCAAMFLSTLDKESTFDILRVGREALFFFLMIAVLSHGENYTSRRFFVPALMVAIFLLIFELAQTHFLASGVYFGFPKEWFSMNEDTLPDDLALYWSAVRPTASFGEPSYLGFVAFSLAVMFWPALQISTIALSIVCISLIIGLVAHSLAFILAFVLFFSFAGINFLAPALRLRVIIYGSLVLSLAFAAFGAPDSLQRLQSGSDSIGDASIFGRMYAPALTIPRFILEHPFGVTFDGLQTVLLGFLPYSDFPVEEFTNNALYNLFFFYGIVGLPILVCLIWYSRRISLATYALLSLSFNGGFFTIDKFSIISLTVIVYEINLKTYNSRAKFIHVKPTTAS